MIFLLLSILCSVSVGVLFKKFKPNFSESFIMITINYLIAIILTYSLFDTQTSNYTLNYYLILGASILLPTVFFILNLSINKSGIIKTDIAQRLSLVIPISSAFLIFEESISFFKWIGIFLGFLSVILMLFKSEKTNKSTSIYLVLVFLGYGIIDVIFKQIAIQNTHPYVTYLFFIFCGAFLISSLILLISTKKEKTKNNKFTYFFGVILGILNFSNIFFYLKAHRIYSDNPSTVFAVMNFGVITLATLIGIFLFKEKLTRKNIIGIVLSVFAIIFVLYSQYKNI